MKPKSTIANFPKPISHHKSESGTSDTLEYRKEEIDTWLTDLKQYFLDMMLDKKHLVDCAACKAGMFCGHLGIASQTIGIPDEEALAMLVKTRDEALEEALCVNLVMGNPKGKTKETQKRYCKKGHPVFRKNDFSGTKAFFECRCELFCKGDYKPRGPKKQ